MPYGITIAPRALKELQHLPGTATARVIPTLEHLRDDPLSSVNRVKDSPFYSVHEGECRVILDLLHQKLVVLVVRTGHRRNIYRKI
jgi:mRNA interferase RelE/StbE